MLSPGDRQRLRTLIKNEISDAVLPANTHVRTSASDHEFASIESRYGNMARTHNGQNLSEMEELRLTLTREIDHLHAQMQDMRMAIGYNTHQNTPLSTRNSHFSSSVPRLVQMRRQQGVADFTCCGHAFGSPQGVLEHVIARHGTHADDNVNPGLTLERKGLTAAEDGIACTLASPICIHEKNGWNAFNTVTEPGSSPQPSTKQQIILPSQAVTSSAWTTYHDNMLTEKPISSPSSIDASCDTRAHSAVSKNIHRGKGLCKLESDSPSDNETSQTSASKSNLPASPVSSKKWFPFAVRQMGPSVDVDLCNTETFPYELLIDTFGGSQWSPGFYFMPGSRLLKSQSYWILEADSEPFAPPSPGEHGAKISAVLNGVCDFDGPDVSTYQETPLFIRSPGKQEYTYMGNYSQPRYSDRLDFDTMMDHIPEHVLRYWAERLADPSRPKWVEEEVIQHFWPKPAYSGPFATLDGLNMQNEPRADQFLKPLRDYASELHDWNRESQAKVKLLTTESLMNAFKRADADIEPGLRLYWEYLKCVRYDDGLYNFLVRVKHNPALRQPVSSSPRYLAIPSVSIINPSGDTTDLKFGRTSDSIPRSIPPCPITPTDQIASPWSDVSETPSQLETDEDNADRLQKRNETSNTGSGVYASKPSDGIKSSKVLGTLPDSPQRFIAPHLRYKRAHDPANTKANNGGTEIATEK